MKAILIIISFLFTGLLTAADNNSYTMEISDNLMMPTSSVGRTHLNFIRALGEVKSTLEPQNKIAIGSGLTSSKNIILEEEKVQFAKTEAQHIVPEDTANSVLEDFINEAQYKLKYYQILELSYEEFEAFLKDKDNHVIMDLDNRRFLSQLVSVRNKINFEKERKANYIKHKTGNSIWTKTNVEANKEASNSSKTVAEQ